jgi:hypothetical protein
MILSSDVVDHYPIFDSGGGPLHGRRVSLRLRRLLLSNRHWVAVQSAATLTPAFSKSARVGVATVSRWDVFTVAAEFLHAPAFLRTLDTFCDMAAFCR